MENDSINKKLELAKLNKLYAHQLRNCYSADSLDSVPTKDQQEFLSDITDVLVRWAVCDNQAGKSAGGARELSWLFNNVHPTFDFRKEWGHGPYTFIVIGKKLEQIELELWNKKIRPLLGPGNYKEDRNSSGLSRVTNLDNGNIIIIQSHNNPEEARKNIQGHTAHYVWLDEMPESHRLVSELVLRLVANRGRLVGTFTPLVHNLNVKKLIDNAALPIAKKYHFSIYDNPALKDRIEEVIETIRQNCATEAEFKCRVGGEWLGAGKSVSCYDPDKHYEEVPEDYDVQWRHVAVVDPSASGLTGLTVWGEDPSTGVWYNVLAKHLQGDAAFLLVGDVESEIARYNIIMRVCDPNPAGFYKEAARQKIWYRTVSEKANRKIHLIDTSNKMLSIGKIKLTNQSAVLEDELSTCVWSESGEGKIVKASSYHCFDTTQYFADNIPDHDPELVIRRTHEEHIRHSWHQAKAKKAEKELKQKYQVITKSRTRSRRFAKLRR